MQTPNVSQSHSITGATTRSTLGSAKLLHRVSRLALLAVAAVAGMLAAAAAAHAQMPGMSMSNQLSNFKGLWNPVVGSGAVYHVDNKNQKLDMEMLVVGTEQVNGKPGTWLEVGMTIPQLNNAQLYAKNLMVFENDKYTLTRTIMMLPNNPPMEMPMTGPAAGGDTMTDIRNRALDIGAESVTVPAGTFMCEHYRDKEGKWGDVWLSTSVTPWGLVKSVDGDQVVTLTKVVTGEADHITGTPQPFNPAALMQLAGAARGR